MRRYYRVWKVEFDGEHKAIVELSRSRKARENNTYDENLIRIGGFKGGYITAFRDSYVNFIGKAVEQLKKYGIKEGDTIVADIDISNEPYVKDGAIAYRKGFTHTVREFELPGSSNEPGQPAQTPKNIDRAPIVNDSTTDEDDLPF